MDKDTHTYCVCGSVNLKCGALAFLEHFEVEGWPRRNGCTAGRRRRCSCSTASGFAAFCRGRRRRRIPAANSIVVVVGIVHGASRLSHCDRRWCRRGGKGCRTTAGVATSRRLDGLINLRRVFRWRRRPWPTSRRHCSPVDDGLHNISANAYKQSHTHTM